MRRAHSMSLVHDTLIAAGNHIAPSLRRTFGSQVEATGRPPAAPPSWRALAAPMRNSPGTPLPSTRDGQARHWAYAGERASHEATHRASWKEPRASPPRPSSHTRGSSPAGPSGSRNARACSAKKPIHPRPRVGAGAGRPRAPGAPRHPMQRTETILRTPRRAQPRSWRCVASNSRWVDPTYPRRRRQEQRRADHPNGCAAASSRRRCRVTSRVPW